MIIEDEEIGISDSPYSMYQIKPKPPKMELNDCIVRYKETGNEFFFRCFLHYYEYRLNKRTESYCLQYGQLNHFLDIKQTIIATMLLPMLPDRQLTRINDRQ